LASSGDENAMVVAERFREVKEALEVTADLLQAMPSRIFGGVLSALDTASFRVDPWLTGVANRRLEAMIAEGAPFRLGAYGWVDAPAPYRPDPDGPLPPGPTEA